MASADDSRGLIKTPVAKLTLGMYVAKLDRPWLESSFEVQGFYVNDRVLIERLGAECEFVFVDPRRFKEIAEKPRLRVVAQNPDPRPAPDGPTPIIRPQLRPVKPRSPTIYEDTVETAAEIGIAKTSIDQAIEIMQPVVERLLATGRLEADQIEAAVTPLVSSVLRNKDAVAALLRIRSLDDYTYSHSISNAVWAAVLGRHLGFNADQINTLSLGCALVDIGKVTLPKILLSKPDPLTEEEEAAFRRHVEAGVEMIQQSTLNDRKILMMVSTHHERLDGSGYPQGLSGDDIPTFGQIAGIIDTYDAMITERRYAPAMSSYEAVYQLQTYAGIKFQEELVEQLTQAIGVFPTGTLVELNTGEVGVVIAQNLERRLRPKVNLILNEEKRPRRLPIITDLNAMDTDPTSPPSVWIKRELPHGAYGIEATDYFV
ncbi:MAG: DUF3391 domain-containing protein [Pseudomonadales bacterium]|nr:HD-GYP domain-containing protein [Pseudomonadales bacterium]NIX08172.1 DUF3391 domain-containing protein [Pseudomonadales bacterium]